MEEKKDKTYKIKEIYYTIQGEGYHTGKSAVFCRFSGCNLWSGLEKDRHKAICKFCDTDFWGTDGVNGGRYSAKALASMIDQLNYSGAEKFVVFTGGEPALQLDDALVKKLHEIGFEIAIETNGTLSLPEGIDWICVSPKADTDIVIDKGHELKLVYPQSENRPEKYQDLDFDHFYLQPKEDEGWEDNIWKTVQYVKQNPKWKLSVQTHKYLKIP